VTSSNDPFSPLVKKLRLYCIDEIQFSGE